jgi:hypothetical protein
MKPALPRTIDAKLAETIEDVLAIFAEVNRRDGRPHCLAQAQQCEAAIVAHRNLLERHGLALAYMAAHNLPWPPPSDWVPGYATPAG